MAITSSMGKVFRSYIFIGCSFLILLGLAFLGHRNLNDSSGSNQTSIEPIPAYNHNGEVSIFDEGISSDYLPLGPFIKGKFIHVIPDAPMFKMMY